MRWEDCGTLSLGDKPAQLSRWNVPKKYAAYSGRAGNNALYLLLPSLPVISLNMCLSRSFECFSEHKFLFRLYLKFFLSFTCGDQLILYGIGFLNWLVAL